MSARTQPPSDPFVARPSSAVDLLALIDATPGVSLLIELEGRILCANAHCVAHFHRPMDQLVGANVFDLFEAATSAGRRAVTLRAAREQAPVVLEDERDGMYFRHRLIPVIDPDGVVRRVAVFAEDITVRKKAELALRASEEQYRFLAENTADTVWRLDGQLSFTYVNGAYLALTGFTREDIIGRSVMDFFTPEGRATVGAMMAKRRQQEAAGQTHQSLRFEVPHVRHHGAPFWAEINSNPIYDASGAIVAYNGIMRDVDERKRHEHALETANRQLQDQLTRIVELQGRLTEQTVRDALTGLHNRRYLEETLPRELARAKRESYPLSLIMVDIDHFKQVNDSYGHPAGDAVIKAMATILSHGAREGDIICRYGGEEFLVALPNMSFEHALVRARIWNGAFAAAIVRHGGFDIRVTLSAGIAAYPDHSDEVQSLVHRADEALYRAKTLGRNRVEVAQ